MEKGMKVHHHDSEEGHRILAKQKLTQALLEKAVAEYEEAESIHVGTPIGLHEEHGFFFSENEDWDADHPDAFKETLGVIPWVQIHELLGNVPEGSAAGMVFANAN
jgi:hypothetical protein